MIKINFKKFSKLLFLPFIIFIKGWRLVTVNAWI